MKKTPEPKQFRLPVSFLNQLNEFTNGYLLLVINDKGDFELITEYDQPAHELAFIKFLEQYLTAKAVNVEFGDDIEVTHQEDEDDDDPPNIPGAED